MFLFFHFLAAFCSFTDISAFDIFGRHFSEICFKIKDIPSCNRTLAESYQPRNTVFGSNEPRTQVFLFTPTSPDAAEPLHSCGGELPPGSSYDPDAQTEIFIHGFLDGVCRTYWMREMKEQLKIRGKYNVVLVDWTWGNTPDLYSTSQNSKVVGEQVGFVLNNIMKQTGIGPEKFHVVGHSYGSVVAGYCGRKVNGKVRRITALDPAFDVTRGVSPPKRITFRDAEIVDVVHTSGSGCAPLASLVPVFCYHLQSIQYYKESINPSGCEFIGVESPCYEAYLSKSRRTRYNSTVVMGMDYELFHTNIKQRRRYYLQTGSACPYCVTLKRNGTVQDQKACNKD